MRAKKSKEIQKIPCLTVQQAATTAKGPGGCVYLLYNWVYKDVHLIWVSKLAILLGDGVVLHCHQVQRGPLFQILNYINGSTYTDQVELCFSDIKIGYIFMFLSIMTGPNFCHFSIFILRKFLWHLHTGKRKSPKPPPEAKGAMLPRNSLYQRDTGLWRDRI